MTTFITYRNSGAVNRAGDGSTKELGDMSHNIRGLIESGVANLKNGRRLGWENSDVTLMDVCENTRRRIHG